MHFVVAMIWQMTDISAILSHLGYFLNARVQYTHFFLVKLKEIVRIFDKTDNTRILIYNEQKHILLQKNVVFWHKINFFL